MVLRAINILTLCASILLLASLSVNIIYSTELAEFSEVYTWAMLGICIIFIVDFFAMMLHDNHPWRWMIRNILMLLLSIPYHTIATLLHLDINHTLYIILSGIVMLRGVMALYITLRWLISRRATRLLWAYMATVVVCTYFAALFFYEFEAPVNSDVQSFGDAMWWAAMNMTTVGAEIFPVTAIGKVICVILPIIGMAMFPIFTVYVTSLYNSMEQNDSRIDGTGIAEDSNKPK